MKIVLTLLIVLVTIIFFDVMMFFFLPNEYALNFNEYREDFQRDILAPNIGMQGPFSKDYFVKHEKRGFDNGKNKKGYHWVNGITYPIWSNSIGCFDKDDKRVKISEIELRKSIDKKLLDLSVRGRSLEGRTWSQRVKYFLRQYSLSAHLMKSLVEKTDSTETPSAEKLSVRNLYFVDKDSNGQYRDHMDSNGQYWYGNNPKAIKNKKAVLAFKKFATENNIPFVMVLMPFKTVYSDTKYYEQLREFLTHEGIRFIDLTFHFRESHLRLRDLYWSHDGHLNPSGNKIVAEILMKELPEVFSRN